MYQSGINFRIKNACVRFIMRIKRVRLTSKTALKITLIPQIEVKLWDSDSLISKLPSILTNQYSV